MIFGLIKPKNGNVPTVTTTNAVSVAVMNNAILMIFHNLHLNYD